VCRDVTERNRDERALIRTSAELKSLSRRLAESEEAVRRKVAADLHDRVGGAITALNLNLTVLRRSLPEELGATMGRRLDDSLALLGETNSVVRELMTELRPPVLDDYGLAAALRWYGEQFGKRTGLEVLVTAGAEGERLAPEREISLFRLVQEALTNIVKHANARTARIALERDGDRLTVTVADDGEGFEPSPMRGTGTRPSWGIVSMRERAESIGGHLTIDSAPGQGTRVVVELRGCP
jgi:two-component system sensor histidine kinase UhpB